MSTDKIVYRPLGVIRTPFARPEGAPIQGAFHPHAEGRVELLPEFAAGLADLDGFSHVVLLYHFDHTSGFALTVTPYLDQERRGLFATRAPRRPNAIGLTVVRLLRIEGPVLVVTGVDMLDGTPLLDIKPYVAAFDRPDDPRAGWLDAALDAPSADAPPRTADDRFHHGR